MVSGQSDTCNLLKHFSYKAALFENYIAVAGVFLRDRDRAGVYIAEAVCLLVGGNVGMTAEEDIPLLKGRRIILTEFMTVGGVNVDAVGRNKGIIGQNGERKNHLVYLGIAVSSDAEDLVLILRQKLDNLFRGIIVGQIVSRTVV